MSRRVLAAMLIVALGAGACGHETKAKGAVAPTEAADSYGSADSAAVTVAWSAAIDGEPTAVAGDAHGTLVTVDQRELVALDGRGRLVWSVPIEGESVGSPVLTGEQVILPVSYDDGSGGCVGIDRETGKTRWSYDYRGSGGAAVGRAGTLAICVMRDGVTAAIRSESGSVSWEFTFAPDISASSIEVPDRTVVAVDLAARLFAFTLRVGRRWLMTSRDLDTGDDESLVGLGSSRPPSAPAVVSRGEIAIASSDSNVLFIIEVRSMRITVIPIAAAAGFDSASVPLVTRGVVIVAARAGEVSGIHLGTRRVRWKAGLRDPILDAHPVVIGDTVILPTGTGRFYGFRVTTGAPVRLPPASGALLAAAMGSGPGVIVAGPGPGGGRIERWEPGG